MGYTANAESTYDFDDQSEFIHVNDEKAAEYFNAAPGCYRSRMGRIRRE